MTEFIAGVLTTLAVEFVVLFTYALCRAAGKESRLEEEIWSDKAKGEDKDDSNRDS